MRNQGKTPAEWLEVEFNRLWDRYGEVLEYQQDGLRWFRVDADILFELGTDPYSEDYLPLEDEQAYSYNMSGQMMMLKVDLTEEERWDNTTPPESPFWSGLRLERLQA